MQEDTASAPVSVLNVAERAHEQLVNIVSDQPADAAYIDVWELYPQLPSERVWAFVTDMQAQLTQAHGWGLLPGREARSNEQNALQVVDALVHVFLRDAHDADADVTYPPDPFAVETWNERP